jgi:hypothetical protein
MEGYVIHVDLASGPDKSVEVVWKDGSIRSIKILERENESNDSVG